jgi:hypothetical protein
LLALHSDASLSQPFTPVAHWPSCSGTYQRAAGDLLKQLLPPAQHNMQEDLHAGISVAAQMVLKWQQELTKLRPQSADAQ